MTYAPPVLASRILPMKRVDQRVATAVLVLGFALLTAACAQITIHLGFTPVPITGQTFAVLLTGAVLGSRAGAASQLLYVVLGAVGLPFYAGGAGGWESATGATAGYLVGFIVAAYVVGYLAEHRQDRRFATSVGAFLTGNLIIYVLGVAWLMQTFSWGLAEGVEKGMAPFIIGDTIKILLVGGAMPTAWKMVGNR
ncbi:MAG: biotin transporter BioY [bacterium]|nr:biotin transporter BioY [bacterium]